jgi:hypothetical protein
MLLINALIVNADGVDFKIHLRSDFSRCGLVQAIDSLKLRYDNVQDAVSVEDKFNFMKQITIFEDYAHDNFEELDSKLENIESMWSGWCSYSHIIILL